MAVVNLSNLAFIRYANIFKRKVEPHFSKPVAIVTDVYILLDEEDSEVPGDKVKLLKTLVDKAEKYDGQCVKSFIAPQWTLQYCLSKSSAFKDKFAEMAKAVHSKTDWTDFDATLANKLKCRSLAKTELFARLAPAIASGEIEKSKVTNDSHVGY